MSGEVCNPSSTVLHRPHELGNTHTVVSYKFATLEDDRFGRHSVTSYPFSAELEPLRPLGPLGSVPHRNYLQGKDDTVRLAGQDTTTRGWEPWFASLSPSEFSVKRDGSTPASAKAF